MEFIILLIIAVILCLILDISLNYIVFGLIILMGVISGLFALAFLVCVVCLLGAKRKEARFVRVDKVKNSKFQVAVYLVEGQEYSCVFPKEIILEDKLYRTDKIYHVMLLSRFGKVFDRFAVTTSILGLAAGAMLSLGILYYFIG